MKKAIIILLGVALAGSALAAELRQVPWNKGNADALRAADRATVKKFLAEQEGPPDVDRVKWCDLAGDGRYELLVNASSGPDTGGMFIYWQEAPGKFRSQYIEGASATDKGVRDLDADGIHEVIVPHLAVENAGGARYAWPAVYRLRGGQYVDASRDFPRFYDDEVLPGIEKQTEAVREKIRHQGGTATESQNDRLAGLKMERNAILRMLGREPTAGLQDAYEWMKSNDPNLLQDAAATFQQIGGHQEEMRAASQAWDRALCERDPDLSMCKSKDRGTMKSAVER